jgi:hypothetical protein
MPFNERFETAMPMKIVETNVTGSTAKLILATDQQLASERIELALPLAALKHPNARDQPLGETDLQYLGEVQGAALLHARDAIDSEIRRLRDAERHRLES